MKKEKERLEQGHPHILPRVRHAPNTAVKWVTPHRTSEWNIIWRTVRKFKSVPISGEPGGIIPLSARGNDMFSICKTSVLSLPLPITHLVEYVLWWNSQSPTWSPPARDQTRRHRQSLPHIQWHPTTTLS